MRSESKNSGRTAVIALFSAIVLGSLAVVSQADHHLASDGKKKLKVLLIDGQNNHNWKETTPVLVEALEENENFVVTVSTTPPANARAKKNKEGKIIEPAPAPDPKKWDNWNPEFASFDVVVSNYNGESWPDPVKEAFEAYVSGGGGFVSVHAADNAFPKWKAYNEMIGVGGWGGRKVGRDGAAWIHVVDGKIVRDTESDVNGGHHGKRRPLLIETVDAKHPITHGLPEKWLHAKDELYCRMCGPAKNLGVQATSFATETDRNEPMLMTTTFGKGRVFHTTLGHDVEAMQCRGFFETLQRGTEWAATGATVRTAAVPDDFPTADAVSVAE